MTSLPGPQAWGSPTSQNTSSRTHCPCGFSDTHHCPQGWRLGQRSPLALSARTHSAEARIQLPEHHHGAFSTLCLSPAFLHQPPNCLPSPTLQPEATRMGSCPIQNPLGVPRDLRIRPQVPYHGLKGSRGPAPTSGLPGSPSESFSCGHPGCLGAFAHTGGPIAAGASSASSFQAPRFLLTNTLHFPAFGAGPTVCRRRPVPSRAARQRPNQPVEGEQLPAVPATAPTFPAGPKTRAAGDPLLGPRRSAPPM